MSKGTPTRTVRISDQEWWEIKLVVDYRNCNSGNPPWTMREFLVLAAREKIAKMARSRGRPLTEADEQVDLSVRQYGDTPSLFSENTVEDGEAFA
jgi:hypothetical protein